MSTSNARNLFGPAQTSDSITSPPRNRQRTSATEQHQTSAGTGFPPQIEGPGLVFNQAPDKDTQRGNPRYDSMMRDRGYYGIFLPMDRKASEFTAITLDCTAIRNGITLVITAALERALQKRGESGQADNSSQALKTAQTLTTGCMMALYCRLRTVNKSIYGTYKTFIQRPPSENLEIPTPHALAIQYLGIFQVENMTRELVLIPTVSATDASTFCVGPQLWSPTAYQTAVEFAKNLGICFQKLDLTTKLGSAWWLLKSDNDTEGYQLLACLPESNYTPEDAVIRALWCITDTGTFHADIADLSSLTMDRGSFLRSPPPDIALTCFYGMMDSPEDLDAIS